MSTVKSKRRVSLLKAEVLAVELLKKTIDVCSSKNNFPIRKKWAIPSDLYLEAREFCVDLCLANDIKVEDRRTAMERLKLDLPSNAIEDSFVCWKANASKGDNRYIIKRTEACIMEIVRNQRELEKQLEAALARIERLNATIEYLAMMSDVDISQQTETSHGGESV